jgi:hypothetical protein
MAVFWLEDLQGAIEVVVFPSSYVQAQSLLTPDAIVCVKGKIDHRDDQPKVIAQEISLPNLEAGSDGGARADRDTRRNERNGNGGNGSNSNGTRSPGPSSGAASAGRSEARGGKVQVMAKSRSETDPLVIQLPATMCTPTFVDRLKDVLASHPGPTPVHLRFQREEESSKTLRLSERFAVECRNGLYAELKVLLGPQAFA